MGLIYLLPLTLRVLNVHCGGQYWHLRNDFLLFFFLCSLFPFSFLCLSISLSSPPFLVWPYRPKRPITGPTVLSSHWIFGGDVGPSQGLFFPQDNTNRKNTHPPIPPVGFEPKTLVFEQHLHRILSWRRYEGR